MCVLVLRFQIENGDFIADRTDDGIAIWAEHDIAFAVNGAHKIGELQTNISYYIQPHNT